MFSEITNDVVNLRKCNGEIVKDIKASVQANMIFIEGSHILIETGDLIQRVMSNSGVETYEVIDPGFKEAFGSDIPAHYQIKHRNLGLPEAEKAIRQITYNFNGHNARVNNNSVDNSVNTANINSDIVEHIELLRSEITRLVKTPQEKQDALEVVGALEGQFQAEKPSKVVVKTLLSALPHAGSIASISSFLLAAIGG
ncbi:hypothetical protein [Colwellia sp. TT2012]|uniref:hypothetical protein n=1 Tax=Colwellia sp. TT2012 TaxID=1720342 RepID=UPI00070FE254|nr:hypothetical protein [Colwellia sp. TT2012]